MKRLPSPSQDCSLGVPEFPEKSCQNNWNPHVRRYAISTMASTCKPCLLLGEVLEMTGRSECLDTQLHSRTELVP